MEAAHFSPPSLRIGDMVYWYHDPLACTNPCLGWISQPPGVSTVNIIVFTPFVGFQEKPSVRHRDDPGLQENADWRQWGAWEYAPQTAQLKKLDSLTAQIASLTEQASLARKQNSGNKVG
jgi:hypothetical protein